jgi:hypothetical protein
MKYRISFAILFFDLCELSEVCLEEKENKWRTWWNREPYIHICSW